MREEIFAGLKNAIERGATLETAVQSFINSGYNPAEVKEAASFVAQGAAAGPEQTIRSSPTAQQQPQKAVPEQTQNNNGLPSVQLSTSQEEVSEQKIEPQNKVLYVPGNAERAPNILPVNYIPYDGARSTRKKRLILLIVFLLIILALFIVGIIYFNTLVELITKFYGS